MLETAFSLDQSLAFETGDAGAIHGALAQSRLLA